MQDSVMLRHRGHLSDLAHRVQDVIDARYADRLLLSDLAREIGVSERTLTRIFTTATGLTPLRYQQLLRLERAEHLIGHGSTIEAAARAVGFEDARMLRRLRPGRSSPSPGRPRFHPAGDPGLLRSVPNQDRLVLTGQGVRSLERWGR
jgi:transcriptional regulator GlxA family with amidase domain